MKRIRMLALLAALSIAFSVLFSVIFPSTQVDHIHENEETCAICATVQECSELNRLLSTAVISSKEASVFRSKLLFLFVRRAKNSIVRRATPVSLKVKLLN